MAEQTGVTKSEPRESGSNGNKQGGKQGSFFNKNKKLILIGGGGAALLLLSHKGSGGSGTNAQQTQSELQAESDALAAEQSALENGSVVTPGGFSADGSGGGGTDGSMIGTPNGGDTSGLADAINNLDTTLANQGTSGTSTEGPAPSHPAAKKKVTKKAPRKPVKKTTKKAPAHKAANPHSNQSGGHGVTVHGRTFPGAKAHHVAPAQKKGGNITQRVTVIYGGHTDVHTSTNQGQKWEDHTGSAPSRRTTPPPRPAPARRPPVKHAPARKR